MSENAKLPEKPNDFLSLPRETAPLGEASHMQDVEAQMRKALGLFGAPRRQEQERPNQAPPPRQTGGFTPSNGHKRRFVQDGEVPVTVLHGRRDHPADAPTNRLEAAESVAAAEHAARERAERALAEANATIHDLQTKLGHASLTQAELQETSRRDHEALAAIRTELRATIERLDAAEALRVKAEERLAIVEEECADERTARMDAERALRIAEDARASAERMLEELDLNAPGPIDLPARRPGRPPGSSASRPRVAARAVVAPPVIEAAPEPVQWWLMPEKKVKRR